MLQEALECKVQTFVAQHAKLDEQGGRFVVRNGALAVIRTSPSF